MVMRTMLRASGLLLLALTVPGHPAWAQGAGPIKVGFVGSISGPSGYIGEMAVQALQLAFEEINAAGGILGRKVEVLIRDSEAKPTTAVTVVNELINNAKIDALLGPQWSANSLAVRPILTNAKILNLFQSGSDALSDVSKYPYGFRTYFTATASARALVNYTVDNLKAKKIAFIHDTTEFGKSGVQAVRRALEERKAPLVGTESFNLHSPDLTTQLTKLKQSGADVLIGWPTDPGDGGRIVRDMATLGWQIPVVGNIEMGSDEAVKLAGRQAFERAYVLAWRNLTYSDAQPAPPAQVRRFLDGMKRKYGGIKYSLGYMVQSYDAPYILKLGMEAAGSTEGPKVAAALEEKLKNWQGVQGPYTASKETHDMVGPEAFTMASPIEVTPEKLQKKAPNAP
jgi:branched-chain amino acid transport system substrate-binding protein